VFARLALKPLQGLGAVAFAALLGVPGPAGGGDAQPSPQSILARAKAVFRARPRPPFVVYTLERFEHLNELGTVEHRYDLRIWYRASDGAALVREAIDGKAFGPLRFEHPRIDVDVDPGPPTFDAFGAATAGAYRPANDRDSGLRTVARVSVSGNADYDAQFDGVEDGWYRLRLAPLGDPAAHRLREISVDMQGYALRRALTDGRADIRFGEVAGVPVVTTIFGLTGIDPRFGRIDVKRWSEYRFEAVAFPAALPDWYFDPAQYGAHARDAPS
jgi:hypothetical protein